MERFYRVMRERTGLLMRNGTPDGGTLELRQGEPATPREGPCGTAAAAFRP